MRPASTLAKLDNSSEPISWPSSFPATGSWGSAGDWLATVGAGPEALAPRP